nr:hypothetical protein [uncultured Novosphingobium sp.]
MRTRFLIAAGLALTTPMVPAGAQDRNVPEAEAPTSKADESGRTGTGVDTDFAGHYYLSGVMETGSEMLLRRDGTFEWYISVGALDQFAHGTWRREGAEIVLSADRPVRDRPLFAYLDTQPWSALAEQERLARDRATAEDAVEARCPFLVDSFATTEPVVETVEAPGSKVQVPQSERDAAADAALTAAKDARARMEEAASRILSAGTPVADDAAQDARQVALAWQEARDRAERTASAAGRSRPDLPDPVLPDMCRMPEPVAVDEQSPDQWQGGLAVLVIDPKSGNDARGVRVALRFADGRESEVTTAGEGMTLVPEGPSADLVSATLSAPYVPGRDIEVPVPPVRSGVVRFSIDIEQIMDPPFERMTLRIDGDALLPDELGRGRYTR